MVGGKCFQADPSECAMEEEIPMKEHEQGSMREQRESGEYSTRVFLRSVNRKHKSAELKTRVQDRYNCTIFIV